jgi:hypothetical protein
MTDEEQIRQVMARYCFRYDRREWEPWLDLFADDGSWRTSAFGPLRAAKVSPPSRATSKMGARLRPA